MNKVSRILGSTVLATGLALGGGALTAGAASANDNSKDNNYSSSDKHHERGDYGNHDRDCKKGHHDNRWEWNKYRHCWEKRDRCDDRNHRYSSYVLNY
jgi:hypothetical protein